MILVTPAAPQHRADVAVDRLDFPERDLLMAVVEDAIEMSDEQLLHKGRDG